MDGDYFFSWEAVLEKCVLPVIQNVLQVLSFPSLLNKTLSMFAKIVYMACFKFLGIMAKEKCILVEFDTNF